MSKTIFTNTFYDQFLENYRKKNYQAVVDSIPTFLKFKVTSSHRACCEVLHIYSLIAMGYMKETKLSDLKSILNNYINLIYEASGCKKLDCFTLLEYAVCLKDFDQTVKKINVEKMITDILIDLKDTIGYVNEVKFEKFFIVLVEVESLLPNSKTFPLAAKVLEFFQNEIMTVQQRESGWPALLLKTLHVLQFTHDDVGAKPVIDELLKQIRILVTTNNEFRKDIAIMISRIIGACAKVIVKESSTYYKQKILAIMGANYEILRDKTITTSKQYLWAKSYAKKCCEKWNRHDGLGILSIVRTIFIGTIDRKVFDEVIVSACVNFMVTEATVLETLDCSNRSYLIRILNIAIQHTVKNVDLIIKTCGRDRGIRTIKKFLSIQTKENYLNQDYILTEIIPIFAKHNQISELIHLHALWVLSTARRERRVYCMHKLHMVQKDLAYPKFETVSTILQKLDKKDYGMDLTFDSLKLLFLQLLVEIKYPTLNEMCRKQIIADICDADDYKNTSHTYVNLVKANVRILECMIDIDHYKSNVQHRSYTQQFQVDVTCFKYEKNLIRKLEESLDYFEKFFNDLDKWKVDEEKDDYITNMLTMLKKIGQWLINRQYKDLAVKAFDLLYQVAKMSNNQLTQIVAAGYLIENIALHPNIFIEEELVTELQTNILQKFKDVDSMSQDERSSFLHAFLELTMYTVRHSNNMEHAKKYMQAINKLLSKYDPEKQNFAALRLKYAGAMFEMIVIDPNTSITPITFIQDIFHRFKNHTFNSASDVAIITGILWDILNNLYEYTQARYEFHQLTSLMWTLFTSAIRNGYILLLAKVLVILTNEYLLCSNFRWKDHLTQLDVVFECNQSAVEKPLEPATTTWSKAITPYIHSNCACFHCSHKYVNQIKMAVASLKSYACYYTRDFETSLQSFQQTYKHWKHGNDPAYVSMLMNYSICLTSSVPMNCNNLQSRKIDARNLLFEALNLCNRSDTYYAQAQDISMRLLASTKKDEIQIDDTRSYANAENEYRKKSVSSRAVKTVKKPIRSASTVRVTKARIVPVEPSEKITRSKTVNISNKNSTKK